MNHYGHRLATTEAGLTKGFLYSLGLPPPSQFTYRDYSTKNGQGDGGQSRQGYKNVSLVWGALTPTQSYQLTSLIQSALDTAGVVYATVDRSNGKNPGRDWIDISGTPHLPDTNIQGRDGYSNGVVHNNVELVINNISIVNDPAVF